MRTLPIAESAATRVVKISGPPLAMPISEFDEDDEDWYDDDSDDPDSEWAPCPECGETVHVITGKCPACGYWLSEADRRELFASESKPMWLKLTAVLVVIALLAGVVGVVVGVF